MKLRKLLVLFVFSFMVFNIGIIKGQAWKCIYNREEQIKEFVNGQVHYEKNFEDKGSVEVSGSSDSDPKRKGYFFKGYTVMGQSTFDLFGGFADGDSWKDNQPCDSFHPMPYVELPYFETTKGTCGTFEDLLMITNEKECPPFLYELHPHNGRIMFAAGYTDPKNFDWLQEKSLTSTGKIEKRINDKGEEVTDISEESSGGTSGCGVFGPKTTKYIKLANNALRIIGPLLVIALGITDFLKILLSAEDKVYKEVLKKFIKRLIALAILLLLPYILFFILKISGVLKMYGIADSDVFCVLGF